MRNYITVGLLLMVISSPSFLFAECKEHIKLYSAAYIAKQIGQSEILVLVNYKINLWEKPTPHGKGKAVGKMIPGSRAVILEKGPEDYKVISPLDGKVGWINKIQVKRVLKQDTETRKPCK